MHTILTTPVFALILLSPIISARTLCSPPEIGVGIIEEFTISGDKITGQGSIGTIFTSDCHVWDTSEFDNPWHGGFHTGFEVTITDDKKGRNVKEVRTPTGVYGDCYTPNYQDCNEIGENSALMAEVWSCCKPLAGKEGRNDVGGLDFGDAS